MRFKIIFLIVICFNIFINVNAKDTTRYVRPYIGYQITIPFYWPCSENLPRLEGSYLYDMVSRWKPALDSFILLFEVHTDCRNDSAYNFKYSQRKADSIVAYMKRKCQDRAVCRAALQCQEFLARSLDAVVHPSARRRPSS